MTLSYSDWIEVVEFLMKEIQIRERATPYTKYVVHISDAASVRASIQDCDF